MAQDPAAVRRARQTVTNLLLALSATVGLMIVMVLIVPRDDSNLIQPTDYKQISADAQAATNLPIITPDVEADWWSNSARLSSKPKDGTTASWYVGFVGPSNKYIGLTQTFTTNATWDALQLSGLSPTGKVVGEGLWQEWKSDEAHDPPKTRDYLLIRNIGTDTILIYGTASEADIAKFAVEVNRQILRVYP